MTQPPTRDSGSPRTVDALADQYVADYAALDPIEATYIGVTGHDGELADISPDGYAAREELTRRAHATMQTLEPVDEREQAAKESFLERLGVEIDQFAAKSPQSRLSVIFSELHNIRGVFDLMDTTTEEGWTDIGARLEAVPAALEGYRATLRQCADEGSVSAKRQIEAVAAQLRSWTGQEGTAGDFFRDLVSTAAVPDSLKADLATRAGAASDAYAAFGEFLQRDLLPRGRDKDAAGREQYARDSRYFLGAEVDLDETYAWGWQELARIEDQMSAVAGSVLAAGADGIHSAVGTPRAEDRQHLVDQAVAALDADPARAISGKAAFRDWMQQLADTTIAGMADVHFDIPEPLRRIECCIAPTNDGGIYYTGPTEDFSRPGRMWWAVPDGIDDFSTWREVTTVFHEGVPGHHLQVGQTVYRTELLNRWQRTMCWSSGHGEGWALYAERLMDELGYLEDPGDKLGMLDSQGFRAARVIVDIGMHLELTIPPDNPFGFHPGETWTPELGLEFMRQHSRDEDARLRFEVNRYLGWPGQAPSYKVGERIWLQAREDVKRRHGADFDLRAFHRAALDLGALGLDPLRQALARL
ncbi:MAG: DUF885 domain-containing protein [Nocardioidaceae bacterium]